jgi:hypothetical protein
VDDCDVAETCNGNSSTCPVDTYQGPSLSCFDTFSNKNGTCLEFACVSYAAQCETVFGTGFTACHLDALEDAIGLDDFCTELYCCDESSGEIFTTDDSSRPADGLLCDTAGVRQCYNGGCESSNDLLNLRHYQTNDVAFSWNIESSWSTCNCNDELESRTVHCINLLGAIQDEAVCPLSTKPAVTQTCTSTVGCVTGEADNNAGNLTDDTLLIVIYTAFGLTFGFVLCYLGKKQMRHMYYFCCLNECRSFAEPPDITVKRQLKKERQLTAINAHHTQDGYNTAHANVSYTSCVCTQCSYKNPPSGLAACAMCGTLKPAYTQRFGKVNWEQNRARLQEQRNIQSALELSEIKAAEKASAADSHSNTPWSCKFCTYDNPGGNRCVMCNQTRQGDSLSAVNLDATDRQDTTSTLLAQWRTATWQCHICGEQNPNVAPTQTADGLFQHNAACKRCSAKKKVAKLAQVETDEIIIHV